ncbi:MAG: aspartyl-tRNA synthetase [Candidatus Xenolissoclinum pacificiensis L6]|uniref:Aspartate--tRNA(Asp/Asn) ligase n=1 Tax=Candidatus Xenolissoclinum pacificiensis L6 TaxID=1401685 RepID=W2UYK5_9RICK|nr:MAG: aspartyl-tRNA synthetase [Candidatus Xenolissoclinum pacificiensis L6]
MGLYRDCNLQEISENLIGNEIKVSGWVYRKRDHGGVLFIDLRDQYSVLQIVTEADSQAEDVFEAVSKVSLESVVQVVGVLRKRNEEEINKDVLNGEVELVIGSFIVLSGASTLPMYIATDKPYPEEMRLQYRYLDLRTSKVRDNLMLRCNIVNDIRSFLARAGFLDIATPILTSSSPEGSRDFIVPSRLHKGRFYALPQAPQIFKQLLMVSGIDKYYQIAPCFRDEDSRADRSPGEFYQVDIEMSFVEQEDVFKLCEELLLPIFAKYSEKQVIRDVPRISYDEAMLKYGSDKPDLRNPIIICDVTDIFRGSDFSIFSRGVEQGKRVRAIIAPGAGSESRSFFDKKIQYAIKELGAAGLGYINFNIEGEPKGPIAKFLDQDRINKIKDIVNIKPNDAVFFSCETTEKVGYISGVMRTMIGQELKIIQDNIQFCWIVDFPYFERDLQKGNMIDFAHNPFSMPQGGLEALETLDPEEIRAFQYDLVCNGMELSSGAIRNYDLEILYKAFNIVGYSREEVDRNFSFMVNALKYGAPPHGGIAPGLERMVMIIANEVNIREVTPFPMNQKGEDLLMKAPSVIEGKALKELGIQLVKK